MHEDCRHVRHWITWMHTVVQEKIRVSRQKQDLANLLQPPKTYQMKSIQGTHMIST